MHSLSGPSFQHLYPTYIHTDDKINKFLQDLVTSRKNMIEIKGWVESERLEKKRWDQSSQSGWSKLIELERNKLKDIMEQRRGARNLKTCITFPLVCLDFDIAVISCNISGIFSPECFSAVSLFNAVTSEIDIPFDLYDRGLILPVYDHHDHQKCFPQCYFAKNFPCFSIFY